MTSISSTCHKKLKGDMKMLKTKPLPDLDAIYDESNILVWYFLLKGPKNTVYDGGYYLGRITYHENHPFHPPGVIMLTPSGRFLINEKLCLTNTDYHPEEWTPTWNIQSFLSGFMSIFMDSTEHGVGHIFREDPERIQLAKESVSYNKKHHLDIIKRFTRFFDETGKPLPPPSTTTPSASTTASTASTTSPTTLPTTSSTTASTTQEQDNKKVEKEQVDNPDVNVKEDKDAVKDPIEENVEPTVKKVSRKKKQNN